MMRPLATMLRGMDGASLSATAVIPLFILVAVGMLVIPVPPLVLDVMVALNLLFAVFLVLAAINVGSVIDLTTFPSLLLLTTVFRLAVSISTTRAILTTGDAGHIVKNFGTFVVGSNLAVGIVVFLVVAIVQFLVITKGGERTAEVGARFTLDALPGKQMSIDADLRAGDIDKDTARQRRRRLEQESQFFGAMDGALRFIKGDSIASLLIVCVNLLGGMTIAVLVNGMSMQAATETYLILSIGDGLVAQIPSILSTVAAGILTTRIANEEAKGGLGSDIATQLRTERRAMIISVGALVLLAAAPGFPSALLLSIGGVLGLALFLTRPRNVRAGPDAAQAEGEGAKAAQELPTASLGDVVVAALHPETFAELQARGLADALTVATQARANELGIGQFVLKFAKAEQVERNVLHLSMEGVLKERIDLADFPTTAALAENLARHVSRITPSALSVDEASDWLESHTRTIPRLVASVQEQVPIATLAEVLRQLLAEEAPITHPRGMLSALVSSITHRMEVSELVEDARRALAPQIVNKYADRDGVLAVLSLDPESLSVLNSAFAESESLQDLDSRRELADAVVSSLRQEASSYLVAFPNMVVAVPGLVRLPLWKEMNQRNLRMPVLSVEETQAAVRIMPLGPINLGLQQFESASAQDEEE